MFKAMKTPLAMAMLITACTAWGSGDHQGGHDPMGEAAKKTSRTVQISMSDSMKYMPNVIQIKRGEAVTLAFKNEGQLKHEAVLGNLDELKKHAEMMKMHPDMEHDDPKSISAKAGETAYIKWKFTQAGTFYVACLVPGHFDAGMRASVIVK
jgi:uncharacterized cupredoxin-like copper-binding protein